MPKRAQAEPDLPGVAAVSRALSILGAFSGEDRKLSLAEVSRRTGLYKSTVLRLVESLEAYGFILRDAGGEFRLGSELMRLGALARRHTSGQEHIEATLREMMEASGESATYYVRRGDERLALYRVDSPKSVRDHIQAGDLLPLHKGAAGRVLGRHPAEGERFLTAISLGERDPELAAVAAPVYAGDQLVGALSLSGPAHRFSQEAIDAMSKDLEARCRRLSRLLSDA